MSIVCFLKTFFGVELMFVSFSVEQSDSADSLPSEPPGKPSTYAYIHSFPDSLFI